MLPSEAPMPPCAATVCERVGNTLDSTATVNPCSASCNDARIPAPPAPTITASKCRTGSVLAAITSSRSHGPPKNLNRPAGIRDQHANHDELQRETPSRRLHVIHRDIAHADPRVKKHREHEQERRKLERLVRKNAFPNRVIDAAVPEYDAEYQQCVEQHHDGGETLR